MWTPARQHELQPPLLEFPSLIPEGLGHNNLADSLYTQNRNWCIYFPQSQYDKRYFPSHPYCAHYVWGRTEYTAPPFFFQHPPSLLCSAPLIQTPLTSHICSSQRWQHICVKLERNITIKQSCSRFTPTSTLEALELETKFSLSLSFCLVSFYPSLKPGVHMH